MVCGDGGAAEVGMGGVGAGDADCEGGADEGSGDYGGCCGCWVGEVECFEEED